MKYSRIQLDDLPDEILIYIFKKLSNVEILYSLSGVNKRINKIAHDFIFTSCLTLITCSTNDLYYPLNDAMLDRFCFQILPKIQNKIKWINVESSSMERILRATNYPNLNGIGFYSLDVKRAEHLFTEKTCLINILKNEISSCSIDIIENEKYSSRNDVLEFILTEIFSVFPNLQYLNFNPNLNLCNKFSFNISRSNIFSSTLLELHINLGNISDCLSLLDGRFSQLHTLYVNIYYIGANSFSIYNKDKLLKLKCFSLHCNGRMSSYYKCVVSDLLHRMPNLEKLDLNLVLRQTTFIDGNELKMNILNYMTRLKEFTFNICSNFYFCDCIDLPSNEGIQHTFRDFKDYPIICSVDIFPKEKRSRCLIYSYPYNLKYYNDITNRFQGGVFKYVTEISLIDEHPFEHEFFIRIAKSFPFVKKLFLTNDKPQMNNNQNFSIIQYTHLIQIVLIESHEDYIEEFLLDTKSFLPYNVHLSVNYRPLKKVTNNFTRDATRINCSKVNYSYNKSNKRIPQHFKDYFLCTNRIRL